MSKTFSRLEKWNLLGDGLSYTVIVVPDTDPLSVLEVLKICRCRSCVINMFDALDGSFIGMAYVSEDRDTMEIVRYGRRETDIPIYG